MELWNEFEMKVCARMRIKDLIEIIIEFELEFEQNVLLANACV